MRLGQVANMHRIEIAHEILQADIFGSYLRAKHIDRERIINLLQRRIEKSVFVRHYNSPDMDAVFLCKHARGYCMLD